MKKLIFTALLLLCVAAAAQDPSANLKFNFRSGSPIDLTKGFPENAFLTLCYHDVPEKITDDQDAYATELDSFIKQLEFLKAHNFNFISTDDIMKARSGEKRLPEKAVLITFDDAYESFYENVLPILKMYRCPAVVCVISDWIDKPPLDFSTGNIKFQKKFMTWDQLREVASSGLVKVASHSNALHKDVLMNPLGSMGPAIQSRIYDPVQKKYETETEYRKRIGDDLSKSYSTIREKVGVAPEILVWPYGRYNYLSVEIAEKTGFKFMFTLDDGFGNINKIEAIPRSMIMGNPNIENFIDLLKNSFTRIERLKIVHADIDSVYDPDPGKMNKNIDAFIERIFKLKPSAVYLQAFCDENGDGNVSSVYFPNRILPVKADIFSRIARSIFIRGIQVYAWMPTMTFVLPDEKENERLRICEFRNGKIQPSTSWYKRLSPFNEEACKKIETIYEDLATYCDFDGVIFQDDSYMNDYEDFSPDALKEYVKISGDTSIPFQKLGSEQKSNWTDMKTEKIMALTDMIKKKVLYYRPRIRFARTLYAQTLLNPRSEEWFCQNYGETLKRYDYAVIMAYPKMEDVFWFFDNSWLRSLVKKASEYPDGLHKTVFKTQSYDWKRDKWISSSTVNGWIRVLTAAGAHDVAYYPDSYIDNKPEIKVIRDMISTNDSVIEKK